MSEHKITDAAKSDPETALARAFGVIAGLVDLVENLHEFDACRVHGIAPGPHTTLARAGAHELAPVHDADAFLHVYGSGPAPGKVRRDAERGESD